MTKAKITVAATTAIAISELGFVDICRLGHWKILLCVRAPLTTKRLTTNKETTTNEQ